MYYIIIINNNNSTTILKVILKVTTTFMFADYFDVHNFINYVDLVNLWTFDFRTPKRVKAQADYAHPLFYVYDRNPHQNAEAHVKWWMEQGAPGEFDTAVNIKIICF